VDTGLILPSTPASCRSNVSNTTACVLLRVAFALDVLPPKTEQVQFVSTLSNDSSDLYNIRRFYTDRGSTRGNTIASVRPSVSTLTFEPSDL